MKRKRTCSKYLIGIVISLIVCVVSAVFLGLYPGYASTLMGCLVVASVVIFSGCCSKWIDRAFEAETGITLSEYYQKLYGGYWREINRKTAQEAKRL